MGKQAAWHLTVLSDIATGLYDIKRGPRRHSMDIWPHMDHTDTTKGISDIKMEGSDISIGLFDIEIDSRDITIWLFETKMNHTCTRLSNIKMDQTNTFHNFLTWNDFTDTTQVLSASTSQFPGILCFSYINIDLTTTTITMLLKEP